MIRSCIAVLLLVCCVWVSGFNWSTVVIGLRGKQRAPSWVPLIGGITGTVAVFVSPIAWLHRYWWVPLVLDWGTIPGHIFTFGYYVTHPGILRDGKKGGER